MGHKQRHRSNVMLVTNEQWNDRFFKACQFAKDGRFMNQKVEIIGWKAFRRGGLIDDRGETKIDITHAAMSKLTPPSFSDYIKFINEHDKAGINDNGEVTLSLTIEITYYCRRKSGTSHADNNCSKV